MITIIFLYLFAYFYSRITAYNAMLVSDIQQCKSIIISNKALSSWASLPPSHPCRSSQGSKLASLGYTAASRQLSVSHMIVYRCQCYFLNLSQPLLPLMCASVHSLHLCLHFFSLNRLISSIFLDSIYIYIYISIYQEYILVFFMTPAKTSVYSHLYERDVWYLLWYLIYATCFPLSDLLQSV